MTVYTGRGDGGRTDLYSGERVEKGSGRIRALGALDELNAVIGVARAAGDDDRVDEDLKQVQHQLHVCQTDLATTPDGDGEARARIEQRHIDWLEDRIDALEDELPELDSFVLQTGTERAARLFQARAVCRRAERGIVRITEDEPVNEELTSYINRLSDLLFTEARYCNESASVDIEAPDYTV